MKGHGFCQSHLRRYKRYGDPLQGIRKDGHYINNKREYQVWKAIKARCLNPKCPEYIHYGGRGITVCNRWIEPFVGFQNFLEDMGTRPDRTSIDRIDGTKGYYPENCRWATSKQQNRNRKSNAVITYKGETHTLAEWSEILKISYGCLNMRYSTYKWRGDKLFSKPRPYHKKCLSNK